MKVVDTIETLTSDIEFLYDFDDREKVSKIESEVLSLNYISFHPATARDRHADPSILYRDLVFFCEFKKKRKETNDNSKFFKDICIIDYLTTDFLKYNHIKVEKEDRIFDLRAKYIYKIKEVALVWKLSFEGFSELTLEEKYHELEKRRLEADIGSKLELIHDLNIYNFLY